MIDNRIAEVIVMKRLKQCDIAKQIGMSAPLFSQIVNGISVPNENQLARICDALGCRAGDLYKKSVLNVIVPKPKQQAVKRNSRSRIDKSLFDALKAEAKAKGCKTNELVNYYIRLGMSK